MTRSFLVGLFFLVHGLSWTQCTLDTNVVMQEVDTVHLLFGIEGAALNDLSLPGQGLCKVRVKFEHEFLGDVRVFLTSPSGQTIQLIGDEGNFGLTQFTEWDVCFVPDATAPVPDPGFSPDWSNNQVWGSFGGTYMGSYHPYSGRLEDFNTGPVNGEWRLSVLDRTIFYRGWIKELELEFCDQNGLICRACRPNILQLSLGETDFCQSDTVRLPYNLDVFGQDDDSLDYRQLTYVVNEMGTLMDTQVIDLIDYPEGRYRLCGLSYYIGDTSELPTTGSSVEAFENKISDGEICASSPFCVDFVIHPNSDTSFSDIVLCPGDSLIIQGVSYDLSGTYFLPLKSFYGCDSTVELQLEVLNWEGDIFSEDTLDCLTDSVLIRSTVNNYPAETHWRWTNQDYELLDTLARDSLWVTEEGEYHVILSYRGCQDTFSTQVVADSTIPTISLTGGNLSCDIDSVLLLTQTNAQNPTYRWFYNNMDLGVMDSSLYVRQGGTYTVEVTDDVGCPARASFLVLNDTNSTSVSFQYDSLICDQDSLIIVLRPRRPISNIMWNGPNGYQSTDSIPGIFESGWYTITYTGLNGCPGEDSVFIRKLLRPDSVSLFKRDISCENSGQIGFRFHENTDQNYQWVGPGGLLSGDTLLSTNRPGLYFFEYTSSNGCDGRDSIRLFDNRTFPDFTRFQDSVECVGQGDYSWVETTNSQDSIYWITPSSDTIVRDSLLIQSSGQYEVIIINPAGCEVRDTFVINASRAANIGITADTINCGNGKMATLVATSNLSNIQYSWIFNGVEVGMDSVITTNEGGWYLLNTSGNNTCDQTDSVFIEVDTIPPQVILTSPDTITCDQDSVEIRTFVNPALARFNWTGPNGYTSSAKNPFVNEAGIYTVSVTSVNGCSDSASIQVIDNKTIPVFQINDDTLTCDSTRAFLKARGVSDAWRWRWINGSATDTLDNLTVDSAGLYFLQSFNPDNGCTYIDTAQVVYDTSVHSLTLSDTILDCLTDSLRIPFPGGFDGRSWTWIDPAGQTFSDSSIWVNRSGTYAFEYIGDNGCTGMSEFNVEKLEGDLNINVTVEEVTCSNPRATLTANIDQGVQVQWIFPDSSKITGSPVRTMFGGQHTVIGINDDGCRDTLLLQVPIDTVTPVVGLSSSGDLVCANESVDIAWLNANTSPDLRVLGWIDSDNPLDTISIDPVLTVGRPGSYSLNVLNQDNGCVGSGDIDVVIHGDTIIRPEIQSIPVYCPGQATGQIDISNITGGTMKYDVFFNGIPFDTLFSWDQLRKGNYPVEIIDANGCSWDTLIQIAEGLNSDISAGMDTTIQRGSQAVLTGSFASSVPIQRFQWRQDSFVLSEGELVTQVQPNETTLYTFWVDIGECTLSDEVIVFVKSTPPVFIPNIFTPNGDGVNDELIIGLGQGVEYVDVQIYDRWGEMVFAKYNIREDSEQLWDGTFEGQKLVPGVFVGKITVVDNQGNTRILHQGITMVH